MARVDHKNAKSRLLSDTGNLLPKIRRISSKFQMLVNKTAKHYKYCAHYDVIKFNDIVHLYSFRCLLRLSFKF